MCGLFAAQAALLRLARAKRGRNVLNAKMRLDFFNL